MKLSGLEGISAKEIDCDYINSSSEIEDVLNKGIAATSAGDNGAINIWKDDDGFYRCESMRFCRVMDKKIFNSVDEVKAWIDKWLKEIN